MPRLRRAAKATRKEANWFSEPLVNDQRYMGRPILETGGDQGTPHNQDHEHFKALKEEGRLRPDSTKPTEIFRVFYGKPPEGEVPGDASKYLSDPGFSGFVKFGRSRPAVFGGHERPNPERKPNVEQREAEPFQPNPAGQQAAERLGKPPPEKAGEVVETLDPDVEAMIREAAMGDPAKEAHLLESAKKHRSLRDFFKYGPTPLTSSTPLFPLKEPEDGKENPPQ